MSEVEETGLTTEEKKKAINLEDLIYIKKFIQNSVKDSEDKSNATYYKKTDTVENANNAVDSQKVNNIAFSIDGTTNKLTDGNGNHIPRRVKIFDGRDEVGSTHDTGSSSSEHPEISIDVGSSALGRTFDIEFAVYEASADGITSQMIEDSDHSILQTEHKILTMPTTIISTSHYLKIYEEFKHTYHVTKSNIGDTTTIGGYYTVVTDVSESFVNTYYFVYPEGRYLRFKGSGEIKKRIAIRSIYEII